jgi:hypothetical protein
MITIRLTEEQTERFRNSNDQLRVVDANGQEIVKADASIHRALERLRQHRLAPTKGISTENVRKHQTLLKEELEKRGTPMSDGELLAFMEKLWAEDEK